MSRPGLPPELLGPSGSSFADLLARTAPDHLAARLTGAGEAARTGKLPAPHATTIVALTYDTGVLMAGDRRATSGTVIAHREIEKVFPADAASVVGVAGTAGIGLELVRLFQLELEHFEKIEGIPLSLEGKANRLAHLVRANLSLSLEGLTALPLLGGYDPPSASARLYSYDAVGGRYAERHHAAVGSGALFARGTLKNRWHPGLSAAGAIELALRAIVEAAEEDAATGGIDPVRGIYPVVAIVDADGFRRVADAQLSEAAARVRAERGAAS